MLWILAIVAVVTAAILLQVDDWSRDFSTNVAMTAESSNLKPLRITGSIDEATEKLRQTVAVMPNWQWIEAETTVDGDTTVHLVRRTALFRFRDDVQVTISADKLQGGVVLNAVSRSRVGKADLGQNPRNIRELFAKISTQNP